MSFLGLPTLKCMFLGVLAAQAGWGMLQKKGGGGGKAPTRHSKNVFSMLFLEQPGPQEQTGKKSCFFYVALGPPRPEI